jgi:hypothetical protein
VDDAGTIVAISVPIAGASFWLIWWLLFDADDDDDEEED